MLEEERGSEEETYHKSQQSLPSRSFRTSFYYVYLLIYPFYWLAIHQSVFHIHIQSGYGAVACCKDSMGCVVFISNVVAIA